MNRAAIDLRAAQTAQLAAIKRAMVTAGTDEKNCGFVEFATPAGHARVLNLRARLERFARAVKRCPGYAPQPEPEIGCDRESHRAARAAGAGDCAYLRTDTDAELIARHAREKAHILTLMRRHWAEAGEVFGPHARVTAAEGMDAIEREMVRRGLLDATDHDKVNAPAVLETVDEMPAVAAAPPAAALVPEAAILDAVRVCMARAAKLYSRLPALNPAVRFDLRGFAAGQVVYRRGAYTLRFNLQAYAKDAGHLLRDTVAHEVAHMVGHALGYGLNHGATWRDICIALGGNGKRCHNLKLEPARQQRRLPPPRPALRAVDTPPRARVMPAMRADDVEIVEAIETATGRIVMAVFDEEFELLGLYEGFEHRIRCPQDLRVALSAPAAGATLDWPPACATAQATYDRITERETAYNVIGRWSHGYGLDLSELRLSRVLGRGPRAILGAALAA